ncbi:MAG: hypothetical protein WA421_00200, partial [Nitrososphaeraceae archaeon]
MKNSKVSHTIIAAVTLVFIASSTLTAQHLSMALQNTTEVVESSGTGTLIAPASSSSLNNIFKQVENATVQVTSKVPTPSNPQNPQAPNATTALGSGFVYDKLGRI